MDAFSGVANAPGANSETQVVEGSVAIAAYTMRVACEDDATVFAEQAVQVSCESRAETMEGEVF